MDLEVEIEGLLHCSMAGRTTHDLSQRTFIKHKRVSCHYHSPLPQVLSAWKHGGLPQRRERLWIVGTCNHARKSALAVHPVI